MYSVAADIIGGPLKVFYNQLTVVYPYLTAIVT